MTTPIREVPLHDRPRERLLLHGVAALSDAELVAVQLGSGHAGASALEVAQRLLATWGGAAGLARALPEELAKTRGVGPAKAARLAAAFGIASRVNRVEASARLAGSSDIAREAIRVLASSRAEQVVVLIANGNLRLRRVEVVALGSATECPMPVREVIATVLRHDGVAFGVAHNHPGGDPTPSAFDLAATDALRAASAATGLRFLDHVVVAESDWLSAG